MKRVLILAYDFPPYVSVGGLRPYGWFNYLSEFGIEPVVVTRQWSNKHGNYLDYISASESDEAKLVKNKCGTIIQTPYRPNLSNKLLLKYGDSRFRFLRKSISAFYEIVQFIIPVGPKSGLFHGAKEYLAKNQIDLIVATGDPFILFSYANKLSKKFNIPWIADYRDPWSQDKYFQRNWFSKKWNQMLEKRIVSAALCIITVSDFLKETIGKLIQGKAIHIIQNGYDPAVINAISQVPQDNQELQIAFVGTVYKWHPINSFLKVFCTYIKKNPDAKIRLNFYGINIEEELRNSLKDEFKFICNKVFIIPKLPNADLLKKLAQNNVMLLFNYYSFMGTKIFDYLGIKRKIILCYSDDPEARELKKKYYIIEDAGNINQQLQADLIKKTNAGIVIKDANELYGVFDELYNEFIEKGMIECTSVDVENYSRKIQAKHLAYVLNKV